jgi:hypothetical protein
MTTIYLQTISRADCIVDLIGMGILNAPLPPSQGITPPEYVAPAGVTFDYIAAMVATPAVLDASIMPPAVITPAVMQEGERANLYLSGPAEALAAVLPIGRTLIHGTTVIPAPANPRRVLA